MAQAKKKMATKTAKKQASQTQARKKAATRTAKCRGVSRQEKMHIYAITGMSIIAGVLLLADAVMMMA